MIRRPIAALAAACFLWVGVAHAQESDLATLLADRVTLPNDGTITAEGNVEVFYGNTRLTAASVRYEREGERLFIEGPITLTEGDSVTVLADMAELDTDLRNGIIRGAKMVLDDELQLASPRIDRVGDRYTQLSNTVATSCRVCAGNPTPLWEIRARRVIHDRETRQIYFEGAQFRVGGLPVAYLPRFRMPDPTLERATGFLYPSLRTSTLLGTGLRWPYFLALGDHSDLMLTPYVSSVTRTVEARYRQRFRFGELNVDTAASQDSLVDFTRAYLFASGRAVLPGRFLLTGDIELVSDPSYLSDYGFSFEDRLDSSIAIERVTNDEEIFLEATAFRTLRGPDLPIKDQVTGRLVEGRYARRLDTGALGGDAWLSFDTTALIRPSNIDILGRDAARIAGSLDWQDSWVFGPGLVASARAGYDLALYEITEDSTFPSNVVRETPYASAELRWPLQRTGSGGAAMLIEPVVAVAWSDTYGGDVPNEDSTLVDFDEGNLFALSRFPGDDRREEGIRAALALSFTRVDPGGWSLGATVGRLFSEAEVAGFSNSTGLTGTSSDWLVAVQYALGNRLRILSRSLIEDFENVTRSETRLEWASPRATVGTVYSFAEADVADNRPRPTSEWTLDAAVRFNRNWSSGFDWRYDTDDGQPVDAGLELRYENECVRVDLSVSRRFASSATVTPTTEFSFEVGFGGFGGRGDSRAYRRSCTG